MSALIVTTSATKMGDHTTGAWHEEFAAPYWVFKDAGLDVTMATPQGGKIPVDAASLGTLTEWDKRFQADKDAVAASENTKKLSEVKVEDFDIIFLSGGHGTCTDFPEGTAKAVTDSYAAGKVVAAVCHGPMGLVNAKNEKGEPLVKGKNVSVFSNVEEEMVKLTDKVPFLLESKMKELGANVSVGAPWGANAVADGRLITGQNPASSEECARLAVQASGKGKGSSYSCLCGLNRYTITAEKPLLACYCHCTQCQIMGACAGQALAVINPEERKVENESVIKFESTKGKFRCVCSKCGSYVVKDTGDKLIVPLPSLKHNGDPSLWAPSCHIFYDKNKFTDLGADSKLPTHEGFP